MYLYDYQSLFFCFIIADRGKILKVVFATNDHQTRDIDPIIAEEIEVK